MKLILFGAIAEQLQQETIHVPVQCGSLPELKTWLEQQYPQLQGQAYAFAVNKRIVPELEYTLSAHDEIALLPPFSGG